MWLRAIERVAYIRDFGDFIEKKLSDHEPGDNATPEAIRKWNKTRFLALNYIEGSIPLQLENIIVGAGYDLRSNNPYDLMGIVAKTVGDMTVSRQIGYISRLMNLKRADHNTLRDYLIEITSIRQAWDKMKPDGDTLIMWKALDNLEKSHKPGIAHLLNDLDQGSLTWKNFVLTLNRLAAREEQSSATKNRPNFYRT
ncbi:uncharacterized protein MKZ38_002778 [Zalerion maritima]|uniref:Uncharacterized protein n=1 Tax=Zalerion maritima TaxID=339359 RepID=A0AAD5RQ39_9PEZI|nr:uncharacterized protein MKZ38_002778 [Zalerion maritima]